jgi:hypothetical protein
MSQLLHFGEILAMNAYFVYIGQFVRDGIVFHQLNDDPGRLHFSSFGGCW